MTLQDLYVKVSHNMHEIVIFIAIAISFDLAKIFYRTYFK